jgi:outer membrane protein OmpA-like peptidoglycan-associated protein
MLLALHAPAMAADWQGDATRILGAPGYLPYAGQLEESFTYTYSANLYDFRNDDALHPSEYDRSENAFLPELTYGITDDISVFADLGWGNSRNVEHYTGERLVQLHPFQFPGFKLVPFPATQSFHALGADDPQFGVTWRAIDQRNAPVSVDVTGAYSPDIFRARSAQIGQNGSFATGGQSGSIEAAVTRDMHLLTLRAYGTFAYEGRRNESADFGTEDVRSAAHAAYTVGLQSEVRVLPFLAVNAGVSATKATQFDRPILASYGTTPVTIKPGGTISPYVGVVLPVVPQHFVTQFLYQHDFVGDQKQAYAYGEVDHFYKQSSNEFIVRVLFAFGGPPVRSVSIAAPPVRFPIIEPPIRDGTYLVFFDWDRADLSTRARQIVAQAAQASTHIGVTRIEANGYTDLSGSVAYNERLSIRRAKSVAAELVRDGVSASEISIHGYGESNPLVPTKPGVREPQNRRVEIIFR